MKKVVIIGCVVLFLLAVVGGIILLIAGGSLFAWVNGKQKLVTYNNELVDSRNKIVNQLELVTEALNNADTLDEITDENKKLSDEVKSFETTVNQKELPKDGQKLKDANLKYASIAKEITALVDNIVATEGSGGSTVALIDQYNDKVQELNDQNVAIAEMLNDLVGFEAVSQSDIDALKNK